MDYDYRGSLSEMEIFRQLLGCVGLRGKVGAIKQ